MKFWVLAILVVIFVLAVNLLVPVEQDCQKAYLFDEHVCLDQTGFAEP